MRSSSASEINRLYAYWLFLPASGRSGTGPLATEERAAVSSAQALKAARAVGEALTPEADGATPPDVLGLRRLKNIALASALRASPLLRPALVRRRNAGSLIQSSVKRVRSRRPISRSVLPRSVAFLRGGRPSGSLLVLSGDGHVGRIAPLCD